MYGAPPQKAQASFSLRISRTFIPGTQKHLVWPMVRRGLVVQSAAPETQASFWIAHFKHLHPKNTFSGLQCAEVWVFGAPFRVPMHLFTLRTSNTPDTGIKKHPFWHMVRRRMGAQSATPEPPSIIFALHIPYAFITGTQTQPFLPVVCRGMGVWSTAPDSPSIFFLPFAFQTPNCPKTRFLNCGLQSSGCMEGHPGTSE